MRGVEDGGDVGAEDGFIGDDRDAVDNTCSVAAEIRDQLLIEEEELELEQEIDRGEDDHDDPDAGQGEGLGEL